eukprot:gene9241-16391_t
MFYDPLPADYTTVVQTSDTTLGPSDTTDVKVWQRALLEAARSVKECALPFTEAAQPLLLDTVVYAHEAAANLIANADEEADQARLAQHDVTALQVSSMFHTLSLFTKEAANESAALVLACQSEVAALESRFAEAVKAAFKEAAEEAAEEVKSCRSEVAALQRQVADQLARLQAHEATAAKNTDLCTSFAGGGEGGDDHDDSGSVVFVSTGSGPPRLKPTRIVRYLGRDAGEPCSTIGDGNAEAALRVSTAAFLSTLPAESFASYFKRPDFTTIDKSVEGAVNNIRDEKWATEMHFNPGHYWFTWPLGESIEQDKEAMQLAREMWVGQGGGVRTFKKSKGTCQVGGPCQHGKLQEL